MDLLSTFLSTPKSAHEVIRSSITESPEAIANAITFAPAAAIVGYAVHKDRQIQALDKLKTQGARDAYVVGRKQRISKRRRAVASAALAVGGGIATVAALSRHGAKQADKPSTNTITNPSRLLTGERRKPKPGPKVDLSGFTVNR